mgnify:FL=1
MEKTVSLKINLPQKLAVSIEEVLLLKGLSLDEAVRLYLRAMVTSSERSKALTLEAEMPVGKYKGEEVEVIARADPAYILWLMENSRSIKFDPLVLQMIEQNGLTPPK